MHSVARPSLLVQDSPFDRAPCTKEVTPPIRGNAIRLAPYRWLMPERIRMHHPIVPHPSGSLPFLFPSTPPACEPDILPSAFYIWAQDHPMGSCAAVARGGGPLLAIHSPSGISIDYINNSQLEEGTSSTASYNSNDSRWDPEQAPLEV